MRIFGRKRIYCSKKLACGVWDRFSVVVASSDYDAAKKKYESLGYEVRQPMGYFNYHAKAKALINGGHLTSYEIVDDWNGIKPALVLHFDNNRSMPIREHKWDEYLLMINGNNIQKGGSCQ